MSTKTAPNFRHKSIRDPLYGFIGLSEKEVKLIDTPLFRRLHFIKQLSHAFVAYPSAIHTRFEHSLGCMHLAGKICDELDIVQDKEDVRLAALLHDIGHGPFSHLFESVIRKCNPSIDDPHELISKIMINESQDLGHILGNKKQKIVDLLEGRPRTPASDIVSGSLDADKLDYLLRDSYHIGVYYGRFDLDRVLHTLRKRANTSLCIDVRGKDAVENYRLGRHLLHTQVYHHHARLIADRMFLKALDIALDNGVIEKTHMQIRLDGDNSHFLGFYGKLDDNSVYDLIIRHKNAGVAKEILQNIRHRRLLKRACDFTAKDLAQNADVGERLVKLKQAELDEMSARIAADMGLRSHEVIFHKSEIQIKLYNKNPIMILKDDQVINLSDYSPFASADSVIRYIVYGPADADVRKTIAARVADELGVDKKIISYLK